MSKTKKIIVICSMVVLLVATAYVNILLNDEARQTKTVDQSNVGVSAFAQFRTTRESSRNMEFEYLNGVLSSDDVTAEAKSSAEELKLEIVRKMESEMILEELIKANGFADAIVTMNDDSLNVVVNADALTGQDVAKICTLVLRETEYTIDQIAINTYS